VPNHALFGRNFEKFWYIQEADTLNIDRAADSVYSVVAVGVNSLHSVSLSEFKIVNYRVYIILASPIDEVCKHQLHIFQLEFPRATKPQHINIVVLADLVIVIFCNPILELQTHFVLFRRGVSGKAGILFWFRF